MAERLHEQVGLELEAGQLLELVGGHRPGGVLGPDRGHVRLTGGAGQDARETAGAADDLLGQGVALVGFGLGILDGREESRLPESEGLAGPGRQLAADDERQAASRPKLVLERRRLDRQLGDLPTVGSADDAGLEIEGDEVAGLHSGHVGHERQAARVLGRIEEDGGDEAADDDPGPPLVGDEGDVLADVPHQRVAGRLAARAGADDVADEGHAVALVAEPFHDVVAARKALQAHRLGVQGDVRPGRRVAGRREIVGVDLAVDLEDFEDELVGEGRPRQEPLPRRPRVENGFGVGVRGRELQDRLELAVDEDDLL